MNLDLKYAINHGIIDLPAVMSVIEMEKKKELLAGHPFKPWQGSNGKWYVYIPDEKKGRVLRYRNTQKEIEQYSEGGYRGSDVCDPQGSISDAL